MDQKRFAVEVKTYHENDGTFGAWRYSGLMIFKTEKEARAYANAVRDDSTRANVRPATSADREFA